MQVIVERLIVEMVVTEVVYVGNYLNINNSAVGALNVDGVQIVEAIDMKIGQLGAQPESRDLATALKQLTEAIGSKTTAIADAKRTELLEQVEALGEQAAKPADQRKRGVISATLGALETTCATVGQLASVWEACNPAIRAFFGF
jgi:hypothetical protein